MHTGAPQPGQTIDEPPHRPARVARLLLLLPFLGCLWVPLYNRIEPSVFGIPFFYWYQLIWIALCFLIIGFVYKTEH